MSDLQITLTEEDKTAAEKFRDSVALLGKCIAVLGWVLRSTIEEYQAREELFKALTKKDET